MKKRLLVTTGLYLLVMVTTIYAIIFERSDSTFFLVIQLGLLIHFYLQYRMTSIVRDDTIPAAPPGSNLLRTLLILAALVTFLIERTVPIPLAMAIALVIAVPTLVQYIRLRIRAD